MRKWYEWVKARTPEDNTLRDFVCMNLYNETQCIRDWIETSQWEKYVNICFPVEGYIQQIIKNNPDLEISKNTLYQWIDDPAYDILLKQSGQETTIENIPSYVFDKFINNVDEKFNLDWDTAEIKLTIQQPGQMVPLHYDRTKSRDFNVEPNKEETIHRWLIMLYDQEPGQTLLMNNQTVNWRAGDVITWNHTQHPHGSANFGFHQRYNVRLTAKLTNN